MFGREIVLVSRRASGLTVWDLCSGFYGKRYRSTFPGFKKWLNLRRFRFYRHWKFNHLGQESIKNEKKIQNFVQELDKYLTNYGRLHCLLSKAVWSLLVHV